MELIKGYPEGSDITIMNTIYLNPTKDNVSGNWLPDILYIVFKDNITGEKKLQTIKNPDYTFYIAKPEHRVNYNRLFISEDEVDAVTCKYTDILKTIAEKTNNKEFYFDNIRSGNRMANDELHKHPDVFFSDVNIEDYYRKLFSEMYTNSVGKISKSFFDIEVDIRPALGDFPEPGECPVNAITVIFEEDSAVYTLLLDDKTNKLIQPFKDSIKDGSVFRELVPFIVDHVGGIDKYNKHKFTNYKYNIAIYDEKEEIHLIKDFFTLMNTHKPDFAEAWNMSFDIPYLIARCFKLGYDANEIMCNSDFERPANVYFIDERNKNVYSERGDKFTFTSYTVYLDQMIQFASRRKGSSQFESYSLDYIGEAVAEVGKLDYKHITTDLGQLPVLDYKTFVFYNIMDVIVQNCIENITEDLEYVFNNTIINNTRYSKVHRQTVYLTNRGAKEFLEEGFIMGSNANRNTPAPETKFPGAFVADASLINDYSRVRINGTPVDIFDNADDFDYSSLYPSILREFNIAPHTQIGFINIPNQVHDQEYKNDYDAWTRGGSFLEDLQSNVWIEFCERWFHLAGYKDMHNDVIDYYNHIRYHDGFSRAEYNKPLNAIQKIDKLLPQLEKKPIKAIEKLHNKNFPEVK